MFMGSLAAIPSPPAGSSGCEVKPHMEGGEGLANIGFQLTNQKLACNQPGKGSLRSSQTSPTWMPPGVQNTSSALDGTSPVHNM